MTRIRGRVNPLPSREPGGGQQKAKLLTWLTNDGCNKEFPPFCLAGGYSIVIRARTERFIIPYTGPRTRLSNIGLIYASP